MFPGSEIDLLNLDPKLFGELLRGLAAFGSILDFTDPLIGPVQ